ncbi:MAG: hypothetical protein H7329_19510 [Opitutaceae bacterium]|nr:hypothetical protein [Cytophagales bacterium]
MILRIRCFLVFSLLYTSTCFAQQDSVYTDTVIIVKDPHIIKRQVLAADPTNPVYNIIDTSLKWTLESFFLAGKSDFGKLADGLTVIKGNSLNAGILLTRNFKTFELGLGIGISSNSFSSTFIKQTGYFTNRDSSYIKVLDSYVQTVDGKDSTFYITEPADTTIRSYSTVFTQHESKNSFSYLEIPISLGYRINLYRNRLNLIPKAQFIWAGLLNHTGENLGKPKKTILKYGFQLNLSYDIIKHLSVSGKVQLQETLTEIYPDVPESQKWSTVQYGLGMAIKF